MHRLNASRHAVMDKSIHVARFFGRDVILDIETFYFSRKMRRERHGIKFGNGRNTGFSCNEHFPRIGNGIADR